MAANLYVAEDGTIHRNPVTVVNNTANRNNMINRPVNNVRTQYRTVSQVSEERIVLFWIVSVIVSILIGIGVNSCLGVTFANTEDYNLWAYFLAALSALGGIVATAIAAAIICVVAVICYYIFICAIIIGFICAILGGS